MNAASSSPRADVRPLREVTLLYHVSRVLDQSLDMRDVVNPVLEALAEYMDMKYVTLTLLNRKTGDILIEAAHGLSPQQARRGRYKLGEGVTGQVVLTGKPAVIPKTSESPLARSCPLTRPITTILRTQICRTSSMSGCGKV